MTIKTIVITLLCFVLMGCVTTSNKSPSEKRQTIVNMSNEVLADLYTRKPEVRDEVANAAGYAVFSNANIKLVLASFGGGYGVARDNSSGNYTYMNMGELGVGFGFGATDVRLVFVFHDAASMEKFVTNGWSFSLKADASAKVSDKGGADSKEETLNGVSIYQITENGLSLFMTLKGAKFWKSPTLN
jgi:lipid-binding SYLF domain-containing protein